MICPKCGAVVNDGTNICQACGFAVQEIPTPPVPPVPPVPPMPQNVYHPIKREFTEDDLPPQYRPLGAWSYFGLQLLFSIPIVGLVFLIVFSFSRGNLNRRSFARSYWCWWIIVGALWVLLLVLGVGMTGLFEEIMYY